MTYRTIILVHKLIKERIKSLQREIWKLDKETVTVHREAWDTIIKFGIVTHVPTGKVVNPSHDVGGGLVTDCTNAILHGQLPVVEKNGKKYVEGRFKEYLFLVPIED